MENIDAITSSCAYVIRSLANFRKSFLPMQSKKKSKVLKKRSTYFLATCLMFLSAN